MQKITFTNIYTAALFIVACVLVVATFRMIQALTADSVAGPATIAATTPGEVNDAVLDCIDKLANSTNRAANTVARVVAVDLADWNESCHEHWDKDETCIDEARRMLNWCSVKIVNH